MQKMTFLKKYSMTLLVGILILTGLYLLDISNDLLFHSLAELFGVIVACGIFMVAWNSRHFQDNNYFIVIGIAYLFIGAIDLTHALAYPGLNVFHGYGLNLAAHLWLASGYVEGFSLLIAPLFIGKKLKINHLFFGYIIIVTLLLIAIFYTHIFPPSFAEGIDVTLTNMINEFIICLILLSSLFLLLRKRQQFDQDVLRLLAASIILTVTYESNFIFSPHTYTSFHLFGHLVKVYSFYLIYKAIIATGLMKPYDLLFRNLKLSEDALRNSEHELTIRNKISEIFLNTSGDDIYEKILRIILEALKSKQGVFGYINREGEIVFASLAGDAWNQCRMADKKIIFPPIEWNGVWGQALREKRSICVNHLLSLPQGHIPIDRALVVPIIHQEQSIGEVIVANKDTDYTSQDQELLEKIVNSKIAPILYAKLQKDQQEKECRRAEETIKRSHAKLDQILNLAADGMRIVDQSFNVLWSNKTFLSLAGINNDDAIGKKCYETFAGPACHTSQCSLVRILNGEEHIECDIEKIRIDGLKIPCLLKAIPFRGPEGELLGTIEDFRDITERKHMEEELLKAKEEAESKYLALVGQAKDGVIIVQDEILKFANRTMANILGYQIEDMTGKLFGDMATPESRAYVIQMYRSRQAGQEVPPFYETRLKSKDGSIKDVDISAGIIQYQGKPATLAIIRDITNRKKMEEELQKTEKLESIGMLAGGLAHDFKNILVAILGNISLAKMYVKQEDRIFELLTRAEKASHRAKDLTHQLLTFSRGGAPVKKPASIDELLKDTASFAVRGSNIKCEFSISEKLWPVEIDEGQISQVIQNLVINAGQAMPKGGIIRIEAENVTVKIEDSLPLKEGNYIKISIKDEGTGIPKEDLRRIFDPYFTTKSKGTGLGLAITYSIIKKHEGYILVESQVGAGTTFFIYLPTSQKEMIDKKDKSEIHSGKGRILFMDDEEDVREVAGEMLTFLGYTAEFAKDGAEAIEIYKNAKATGRPFEVIIMDLTIPAGMGGEETIKRLLEIDPQVKAIVSSGYANSPIMSCFKNYGFREIIPKPYEIGDLSKVLHKVIK